MLKIAKLFDYTAMGIGNHDWDDGPDGLMPFLRECEFPVLGANLRLGAFPELNEFINNSTIGNAYYRVISESFVPFESVKHALTFSFASNSPSNCDVTIFIIKLQ